VLQLLSSTEVEVSVAELSLEYSDVAVVEAAVTKGGAG